MKVLEKTNDKIVLEVRLTLKDVDKAMKFLHKLYLDLLVGV